MAACPALLDRNMVNLLDRPQSLCEYAGSVLLVVNTASELLESLIYLQRR